MDFAGFRRGGAVTAPKADFPNPNPAIPAVDATRNARRLNDGENKGELMV
jgi:hypothetical protein